MHVSDRLGGRGGMRGEMLRQFLGGRRRRRQNASVFTARVFVLLFLFETVRPSVRPLASFFAHEFLFLFLYGYTSTHVA